MAALLKKQNKKDIEKSSRIKNVLNSGTKIYFVEYVMCLISLGAVIVTSSLLFIIVSEYFLGSSSVWLGASSSLYSTVTTMVALAVFMSLLFVFLTRVKNTDRETGFSGHGRLLGFIRSLFLIGLLLAVVISVITVLATLANQLVKINVPGESEKTHWMLILNALFVAGISLYSFLYFYYQAGTRSQSKFINLAYRTKTFLGKLSVLSVLLIVLVLIFPIREQRGMMIDLQISADMYEMNNAINSVYYKDYVLPKSLNDVELDTALKVRIGSFHYTYSAETDDSYVICATFKTDTTTNNTPGYPREVIPLATDAKLNTSASSMIYPAPPDQGINNPYSHKKGKDCFTFNVYGYGGKPILMEGGTTSSGFNGSVESVRPVMPTINPLEYNVSEN